MFIESEEAADESPAVDSGFDEPVFARGSSYGRGHVCATPAALFNFNSFAVFLIAFLLLVQMYWPCTASSAIMASCSGTVNISPDVTTLFTPSADHITFACFTRFRQKAESLTPKTAPASSGRPIYDILMPCLEMSSVTALTFVLFPSSMRTPHPGTLSLVSVLFLS